MITTVEPTVEFAPVIVSMRRHRGLAGQVSIDVVVDYVEGGETKCTFVGSSYGTPGPVVMADSAGQVFVTDPGRFGDRFDTNWVRAFYGTK